MKELRCFRCGAYLGEIEKGKIKKQVALVCHECDEKLKITEATMERLRATGQTNKYDDIFKEFNNMFGGDLFGDMFKK